MASQEKSASTDRDAGASSNGQAPALPVAGAAAPLARRYMPDSFDISVAGSGGLDQILFGPQRARRQPMRGFEDTYADIVDYILRITHRIWEEKDFGYIYDTYRAGARVTGGGGPRASRDEIIAESVAYSSAFPDLRLYGEEVIWAGDENIGFRTSHRLVETGRNTGWSHLGPPSGKRIAVWCLANCTSAENQIFDEWMLDNTAAVYLQLGVDLKAAARRAAAAEGLGRLAASVGEIDRLQGQGTPARLPVPTGSPFDPDAVVRYALHTIWNWRNLSHVDKLYASNVRFHGSTNRELYGRGDVRAYVMGMLSMFPDLALAVDEIYYQGNDADGYLVAVRWSMTGTHLGPGGYGPPTGRRAYAWGLSQLVIQRGQVTEEWNLFNEFEVLQQLLGDEPAHEQ